MTAGGQALLQSVREGREKGVGPESQDGAADTPPLGAEQAASSRRGEPLGAEQAASSRRDRTGVHAGAHTALLRCVDGASGQGEPSIYFAC